MAKIPIEIEVIDDKAIQSTDVFAGSLGGVITGIKGMTLAARAFIATPIGAIIAAIGLALGALTSFFKRSEKGQNALNKVTRIFSSILDNVLDVVDQVGEAIFEAISNPKQLVIDLGNLIKENLINRFKAFAVIGKAIAKIFSGEFKEGFEDLANGAIQLSTGITDFTDKAVNAFKVVTQAAKDFGDELARDIEKAKELADFEANLNVLERQFTIDQARRQAQIAKLRLQAREEEDFTAKQRREFLEEAEILLNKQLEDELRIAKIRQFVAIENNKLANSTIETKQEEAEAVAALFKLEEKRFNDLRALQREFKLVRNQEIKEREEQFQREKELADAQTKEFTDRIGAQIIARAKAFKQDQAQKKAAVAAEERLSDATLANISAIADAGAIGAKLLGERTAAGIALGVATATADTFIAANKTLVAFPGPAGLVLAGVIIAAGLANVAKIIAAGQSVGVSESSPSFGGAEFGTVTANQPTVAAAALSQRPINVDSKVSVEEINDVNQRVSTKVTESTIG